MPCRPDNPRHASGLLLLVADYLGTLDEVSLWEREHGSSMIMNTRLRISRFSAAAAALVLALACAATAAPAATGVATTQTRPDRATQMLFDAVHTNDFAAAEAAVAAGANVEARDRWDISAIELAIDKGYFRIAHFLVSVRNSRAPTGDTASQGRTQPAPAIAPAAPQAVAAPARRAAPVPPPAQPAAAKAVAQPQWPADKPNPFDPATPAFGTALPVIPPAQAADALTRADDGLMLATEEAIRRGSEGLR
jgi:hypothetical protein